MNLQQEGLLAAGLRSYVHAVARALRVEPEAAWCEVAEMCTAYVAVRERAIDYPDRDVMVLWDERVGWLVALEPRPDEKLVVLAHVDGDVVPEPPDVARVVAATLTEQAARTSQGPERKVDAGRVRAEVMAYALPVVVEQALRFPRPA
nr:DUF6292 family protein [Kibdelosporangium sp. MJ126-NF4]